MDPEDAKKLAIVVCFFLFVSLIFFFFFWRPKSAELKKHQMDLSTKTTNLLQLEQDVKDWPESFSPETMAQYEDELEELWALIPSEEEVAMLLDGIESRARNAELEILSLTRISTGEVTIPAEQAGAGVKTQYVRVPYRIRVGGSYFGLMRFLHELERSERLVIVTSIEANAGARGSHPVNADIGFNIFYSKVEVETA